jgi:outer membrane protein OmpA-like peptidoglycan-associated protein
MRETAMPISRRIRAAFLLLFVSSLLAALPASAAAAPSGFSVNRFEPSERGSQWFVLDSLDLRGSARPALGAVVDYQYRPLAIYESDGSVRAAVVGHVLTAHLGGAIILWDRLRLAASLPVVLYTDGEQGTLRGVTYDPPSSAQAIGDARLGVDARMFGTNEGPLTMAIGARLWLPTGSTSTYSGDGGVRVGPHLLAAGVAGPVAYGVQTGVTFRNATASDFAGSPIDHELFYGVSAGVRAMQGKVLVGPELHGSTILKDAFKTRASPLEILLGGHFAFDNHVRIGAGVGTGLVAGYGSPVARFVASLEWSPEVASDDEDGDGIKDAVDACRKVRGVPSTDPELNGCPPPKPTDTDGDDIPDAEDACPDVLGQHTNDPRTNGCIDRDGDGLMDPLDTCPFEAGAPSPDPKKNGCPPPDGDSDGVLDEFDACPNEYGVKTSDPKTNGCAPVTPSDPDRDQDGIVNEKDACPDDAGKPDPDPKKNGCPVAVVRGKQIRLTEQVKFKAASAEILKDSDALLEAVKAVLDEHPEITKLRIEGHTDNRGAARANQTLSLARATAVRKWLVAHGIAESRLTSFGFGADRPIESNDTEEGRAINRRVELHIEAGSGAAPAAP